MTKNKQASVDQRRALPRKGVKAYQRVTGNEGPSPVMKQYLKTRQKGQSSRPGGN
jgi:hypothetical protein